ncbi:hypothetical protein IV203_012433 [Nitzschia inconspicua]|uniref:Sulfotransferase n=1 Tax=Nitzschia inconspicua TaxID=303405 RepID=A0A9K3KUK3_9STRA|nr:hypothetical protein IV203_012433 [Nitzschia inconspicua]
MVKSVFVPRSVDHDTSRKAFWGTKRSVPLRQRPQCWYLFVAIFFFLTLYWRTEFPMSTEIILSPFEHPSMDNAPDIHDICKNISFTSPANPRSKPVWVASFPGSGAEMFRLFVESITGGEPGWSIYDTDHPGNKTCTQIQAATCKTHWPVLLKEPPISQHNLQAYHAKAIVLLRNPSNAFPSRLNHQFEIVNRRGYHTQQAPEKIWNRWIRKHMRNEVRAYQNFVRTWRNVTFPSVALYVPYEGLINPKTGLFWAIQVSNVLRNAGHSVPVDSSDLECLWKRSIFDKPKRKRGTHTYKAGYTPEDHGRLQQMIQELLGDALLNGTGQELHDILQDYASCIANATETRVLFER